MKKTALALIAMVLLIAGCAKEKSKAINAARPQAPGSAVAAATKSGVEENLPLPAGVDYVIKEKMFIAQVNDIYTNRNDYMGKTIMLEGLFKYGEYGDRTYCFVIRNGPGCCGDDGEVGFEVSWNEPSKFTGEERPAYPKPDDWVQAQGVLKRYVEDGTGFLYLDLVELNVMEKRGQEFVNQ